jgi:hypothetical protein
VPQRTGFGSDNIGGDLDEEGFPAKRLVIVGLLLTLAAPVFAKTHKDVFNVPCSVLWPALKDTLRNSGKYGIIGIDNTEMTASYNIGRGLSGEQLIIDKIKASPADYQLDTDDLVRLKQAGIGDGVISALIQSSQRQE